MRVEDFIAKQEKSFHHPERSSGNIWGMNAEHDNIQSPLKTSNGKPEEQGKEGVQEKFLRLFPREDGYLTATSEQTESAVTERAELKREIPT